jgi:fungal nitric oxide reductase
MSSSPLLYIHIVFAGLLFKKLPKLKLAIPYSDIKYTESTRDIGVTELPVTW